VDSQFKQRLTGAVILVLLAVLLVPELLTGPKSRPAGPTSSATTPAQGDGAPLRSYDIDLSETPQPATAAEPLAREPAGPSPPSAAQGGAAAAASRAPRAVAAPLADDEAPRPAARTARPASTAPAAPAAAAAEPAETPPAVAMRGFAVQVGSFASRASADRLAADLSRRRFDTFVSPVRNAGRQLFRVRVGPVADRAAAQALAARLKAAGQQGSVVSLP
jgi:DedD protein